MVNSSTFSLNEWKLLEFVILLVSLPSFAVSTLTDLDSLDKVWTRFGVHYGLFLGAIRSGATPNQFSYWLEKGVLGLNGMIGCFVSLSSSLDYIRQSKLIVLIVGND